MIFPYKRLGNGFSRPIIPIDIRSGVTTIAYEVLVDSGADFNLLPADVGESLGLSVEDGREAFVGGITDGGIPIYIHPVSITVGGWSYNVEMAFMPDMPAFGYGIVGQRGFFDLFTVQFDLSNERIDLEPN